MKTAHLTITFVVVILAFYAAFFYINAAPTFWYDETGQFWMSKGLNHFSPPLSPEGKLSDVLVQNRTYNLDPGGFTVLLYFWSMISDASVFLRLLPALFFFSMVIVLSLTAFKWTKSVNLSLVAAIVPLCSPLLSRFAFELRAYSMESLCTALALWCFQFFEKERKKNYFLFAGLAFAFLLTSRYSVIIVCFATAFIFWRIQKKNMTDVLIFLLPNFIVGIAIYFFTLQFQNPGGTPPQYVEQFLIRSKGWMFFLKLFGYNLFSKAGFPLTIFLVLYTIYYIGYRKNMKFRFLESYRYLYWFSLILQALFMLLSILGKYPWSSPNRFGISLQVLSVAAFFALIAMSYEILYKMYFPKVWQRIVYIFFTTLAIVSIVVVSLSMQSPADSTYYNLSSLSNQEVTRHKFYISHGSTPTIRFLIEYGPLAYFKNSGYPQNFFLDDSEKLNETTLKNFDYFIFSGAANIQDTTWISFTKKNVIKDISVGRDRNWPSLLFFKNR